MLEDDAAQFLKDTGDHSTAAQLSIAVSLKRIADSLDAGKGLGIRDLIGELLTAFREDRR